MPEHPFAQYVRILGKGKKSSRSLTEAESYTAMSEILAGNVEPVQLGAFLMLLRVKEESPEELVGFIRATKEFIAKEFPAPFPSQIDWPSYSGKHKHQPWYLLAALLLAEHGYPIFMHGAAGHTEGRLYSEQILPELGIPVCQDLQQAAEEIKRSQFAFCPLRVFCPTLHQIIDLRNTLGLRSPVHTLARLLNPSQSSHLMVGIFHPSYRPVHLEAGQSLGYQHMAVFKGEAGEVERKPDARCTVQNLTEGAPYDEEWPPLIPFRHPKPEHISVEHLKQLWSGETKDQTNGNDPYGENAIVGTVAIALKLLGKARSQEEAIRLAQQLWTNRNRNRFNGN
ncbi:MAG: glycosyl transferase [Gammaproteobacteria bacterium]|nr:MAG: glycosyl transferase [Gammaproteobacteria bacterium]